MHSPQTVLPRPRVARDGLIARDNILGNAVNLSQFGWLGDAITLAGQTRRHVVSLVPENEVVINQSYPIQLMYTTPGEVLAAAKIAVQGVGVKAVAYQLAAAAGADTTQALVPANTKSFGVRFTIGDNVTTFKFGTYDCTLLDGATAISQFYVVAKKQPIDIVAFGITNVGGLATIVPIANPTITVKGSAAFSPTVTASTAFWYESLNMRDIGVMVGP